MTKILIKKYVKLNHGRRKKREVPTQYPVIHFSSWMTELLTSYPKFLGGFSPVDDGEESYLAMFGRFGDKYRAEQPQHPIFEKSIDHQRATIPSALHGDEGRGLTKVPLLALAFQVETSFSGENNLNSETFHDVPQLCFSSYCLYVLKLQCKVRIASHQFAPKRLA